jgi:hypothetical protein
MYFKWLVAHRKPSAIIRQSIKHILVPEGQDMYRRYLQCDDHVFSGTLMYSHWNLPVDRLCLLLSKFCGYNISARFEALDVGRRDENPPLIRSMRVECSAKDKANVQQFLESHYNTQSPRTIVLGIKLRLFLYCINQFVLGDMIKSCGSIIAKPNSTRCCNGQICSLSQTRIL